MTPGPAHHEMASVQPGTVDAAAKAPAGSAGTAQHHSVPYPTELTKKMDTLKKVPPSILSRLYTRLFKYYKGDPGKLTLFTMFVLVLSEMPIYFFTLLDLLKLKSLWKYRLHYDQTETYG